MEKEKKIVIALGGNALGKTPQEQLIKTKSTAKPIVDLIELGNTVVISHGNGPQVGMINSAFAKENDICMPFPECGAMSQGYIGYHLQNAIREELLNRQIQKEVVSLVTQVVVDVNDYAFKNPSKPIGRFYNKEEAKKIADELDYIMKEDSGRGYRRVVPSPKPVDIAEIESIKLLVDNGVCVITTGGGGIPVYKRGNSLKGVEAVIDKDYASAKLAELLDADELLILTAVEKVAINYGEVNQKDLDSISVEECKKLIEEKQFGEGSMLPKVKAAMSFCESKEGRRVLISSLDKAGDALLGKTGTLISL